MYLKASTALNVLSIKGAFSHLKTGMFVAVLVLAGCSASDSDAEEAKAKPTPQTNAVTISKAQVAEAIGVGRASGNYGAYLAATAARSREDVRGAADNYLSVLKSDPHNPVLMSLALMYVTADGRMQEARALAQSLGELKSDNMLAGYICMASAAREGNWGLAKKVLKDQQKNSINNLLLPLIHGWIALGDNQVDQAIHALEPLAGNSAFLPVYNFHLALILDYAGRNVEAESVYEKVIKGGGGRSIHAVQAAGRFYNRIGKVDKTIALMQDYVQTNGDGPIAQVLRKQLLVDQDQSKVVPSPQAGLGEAFFSVATSLSNAQIWELSLALSQLALDTYPELDLAKVLVGDLFESHNDYERANEAYAAVSPESPAGYSVRLRMAKNLQRTEKVNQAADALRALAKEFPNRPGPLIELGDLHREQEDYRDAIDAYSEALTRIKELSPRHWVLFYTRGVSYERSKEWAKAEADFLKALELEPDQPLVLNYLGYSWLDRGENMDQAQEMIEKAVKERPSDGYIVDSLGWAYYLRGKYEKAVEQLEQAVVLISDDATINDHLGDAYWQVGRKLEAQFQWRRALSFNPSDEQMKTIQNKLQNGLPIVTQ